MDILWGGLMTTTGAPFVYWGTTESTVAVYRLPAARSRILWGDRVHRFYQIVGAVLVVLGLIWYTCVIW